MGNIIVERTDEALTFQNPGMMLVSKQQYFEGGRSICRNPTLQKMFMRLGRAEKAGSGVDKIVSGWRYLGWPTPTVTEETRPDYVVLTMRIGKSDDDEPTRKPHKKTPQENPTRKPHKKDVRMKQILEFCKEPRTASEILENLGLSDRKNLMETYLNPMLETGMLTMTEPETPTSRNQKYKAIDSIR